ncbi:ABC transporter ATP-binding protein [Bryobacter aggregatus]|uniref:ABC transporter ATP-binding protein n=1 Tax=Bryobacter aggregatus TaxID=360054 RepID=UPI00056A797A|nr:ABC transporter ATP-binding protein [Bryobacter aggregatus]
MSAKPPKKKINYSKAFAEARTLVHAHRWRLVLGLTLMLITRGVGLVLPASTKYVIDEVIGKGRSDMLWKVAVVALGATIVQALSSFAVSQVLGVAAQRAITEMRKRVQAHIERLPVSYFDSMKTGQLISRIMQDAEGVRNLVGTGLVQLTGGIVTAVLCLGVLCYLNWKMTLLTIGVLGVFGSVMSFAFKKLRPLFRLRGEITAQVTGRLTESLGGIRVVKAYTAERRERLVFSKGVHRLFRNIAESMTGVSFVMAFSSMIVGAIGMVIFLFGGSAVIRGEMTLGDLFMYAAFTGLMAMPVVELASIGTQLTEAFAGLDRIREVLDVKTEDAEDGSKENVGPLRGEIVFDHINFEYTPGALVLKDVSFTAPAGSTTALVGSSGSGKSTMISLVMNFNQPKSGRVLVDGRDLQSLKMREYRSNLGVVFQDNFLFDGTIAENVSFAQPGATRAEIEEACRVAHCAEFIERFEKGYDTIVGERGVKLSGGQRQRVAIARAILADPKILILDEATSSLDSESEALIQDALRSLRHGRTTFVIAHRLSTIRAANQILVIEDGEIVERGTHAELMAMAGRYRELHDRQHEFEKNQFINPGEDFTSLLAVGK